MQENMEWKSGRNYTMLQDPDLKVIPISIETNDWSTINAILQTRPELVNQIEGNDLSGLLHQAIEKENEAGVIRLLAIEGCNPNQLSKNGINPKQMTENDRIKKIIEAAQGNRKKLQIEENIKKGESINKERESIPIETSDKDENEVNGKLDQPGEDHTPPEDIDLISTHDTYPIDTPENLPSDGQLEQPGEESTPPEDIDPISTHDKDTIDTPENLPSDGQLEQPGEESTPPKDIDPISTHDKDTIDTPENLPSDGQLEQPGEESTPPEDIDPISTHGKDTIDTPENLPSDGQLEQPGEESTPPENIDPISTHDKDTIDTPENLPSDGQLELPGEESTPPEDINPISTHDKDAIDTPKKLPSDGQLEQPGEESTPPEDIDPISTHDKDTIDTPENIPSKESISEAQKTSEIETSGGDNGEVKTKQLINTLHPYYEISYEDLRKADALRIEQIGDALDRDDMDEVVYIIDTNQHLVNVVPPKIGLGPLHKAALMGDVEMVNKLLSYPASNPDIETTASEKNPHGSGKRAEQLTRSKRVIECIERKKRELSQTYLNCPTFVDMNDSNKILLDYTALPLDVFKGLISSEMFSSGDFNLFTKMVEDIFLYLHFTLKWENAKEITCRELNRFDHLLAEKVMQADTKSAFYNKLIWIYTKGGSKTLYENLNNELRNQAVNTSIETICSLKFRSYAAIVNAIMFVWDEFQPYTGVTYRGMDIAEDILERYKVGTEFAWVTFVSSSSEKTVAKRFGKGKDKNGNTLFIFDNKTLCKWSPKSIENSSQLKDEKEYLYPSGAQFRVTKVEKDGDFNHIYLKLLNTIDPSDPRKLFDETVKRTEQNIENIKEKLTKFNKYACQLTDTANNKDSEMLVNKNLETVMNEENKGGLESLMQEGKLSLDSLLQEINGNIVILEYELAPENQTLAERVKHVILQNKNKNRQQIVNRLRVKRDEITESVEKAGASFRC